MALKRMKNYREGSRRILKGLVLAFLALGFGCAYVPRNLAQFRQNPLFGLCFWMAEAAPAALLLGLLGYTVIRFERIRECCKNTAVRTVLPYGLVLAAQPGLRFDLLWERSLKLDTFDRVIGVAAINDYDVEKLVRHFGFWILFFAVALALSGLAVAYLKSRKADGEQRKAWAFLDDFMIVAAIQAVLQSISFFADFSQNAAPFRYGSYLTVLVIMAVLVYICLGLSTRVSWKTYCQVLMGLSFLAIPVAVLLGWPLKQGKTLALLQLLFFALFAAALLLPGMPLRRVKHVKAKRFSFLTATGLLPLGLFGYIALINILAARGYVAAHPRAGYAVSVALTVLLGMLLHRWARRREGADLEATGFALPGALFGICALAVQIPLTDTYLADVFESANHSILTTDFLLFGKVPLVEHYGGHMMTGVWEGLLYGLLNGDVRGAAFSPYQFLINPVLAMLLYFLIRELWNDKMAFWSVLLLPIVNQTTYFALGLMTVLATVAFIQKPGYRRGWLMWLGCIWCALYRLDLGFSFDLACVITLGIYICKEKKWSAIKPAMLPLLGWAVIGITLWAALCLHAGVNPVNRLIEFLEISASNQNWAYSGIGDPKKSMFVLSYVLIPLTVAGTLCYSIFCHQVRERAGLTRWILLLTLGVAYFTNFSRGLVRHSTVEGITYIAVWCAPLYLAAFCSCVWGKKLFLPILAILFVLNAGTVSMDAFSNTSFVNDVPDKIESASQLWKSPYWQEIAEKQEKVDRVQPDESIQAYFAPLKGVTELLLKEGETFADFTNSTFGYSYLQKECPVYVSQSPLQLSGEYAQEQFVAQLERDPEKIPIALLPLQKVTMQSHLDWVPNAYRYYKVSEYLYSHYVPLCAAGSYGVWCVKDRYEEYAAAVAESIASGELQALDYGYDCQYSREDGRQYLSGDSLHIYELNHLPRLWGEQDSKKAWKNPVLARVEQKDGRYTVVDAHRIQKTEGNYLKLVADCDAPAGTGYAIVRIGRMENDIFIEKMRYSFALQGGQHTYLLRISSDYHWYGEVTDTIILDSSHIVGAAQMEILQGD